MIISFGQNTLGGLMIDISELVNARITGWTTENLVTSNWQETTELNILSIWSEENLPSISWNKEL